MVIRNGTIRVTKRAGLAMGIKILSTPDLPLDVASDLAERWSARDGGTLSTGSAAQAQRAVEQVRAALPARPQDYGARRVLIEQVRFDSAGWGIGVEGAGTVIRNSTIEVDSGTALWIYGPNAVIENNTIIVKGKATVVEADAAIRLHHGDGAVIRNNRIILKGDAHPWAISVFRTGPFTLEGNTVNDKALGKEGSGYGPDSACNSGYLSGSVNPA